MTDTVIDQSVLDELQEAMGAEFAAELVDTFLQEAPGMMAELTAAADKGDGDGYRRAAHSIKSNADVFGASTLAQLAREMELSPLATPESAKGPIAALDSELTRTSAALKNALNV